MPETRKPKDHPKNTVVKAKLSEEQTRIFHTNKKLRGYSETTDFIINATIGEGFWVEDNIKKLLEQNREILLLIRELKVMQHEK